MLKYGGLFLGTAIVSGISYIIYHKKKYKIVKKINLIELNDGVEEFSINDNSTLIIDKQNNNIIFEYINNKNKIVGQTKLNKNLSSDKVIIKNNLLMIIE